MYYWQPRYNWIKFGAIALAIHGVVLSLPVARHAPRVLKERLIDVVIMRQEPAPPPPPVERVEAKPAPKRAVVVKTAPPPRVKEQVPIVQPKPKEQTSGGTKPLDAPIPRQPEPLENKAEAPGAGAGNVLDEQITDQVVPAPGIAGSEGVGIAGVNTSGGRVGLGGGGTGVGTGAGGTGTGTGFGSGGGGTGGGSGGRGGGGTVRLRQPPAFAYHENPEYPPRARRLGKEGRVVLDLCIDEKGNVTKVDVVEATDQMFVTASVSAVKRWKFQPYKKDGVPTACKAQVGLPFRIQ